MPLRTRRWNDPAEPGDGLRVLICRFRPRGVRREEETWELWLKDLGPSAELHAAFYGKAGAPISLEAYRERFLREIAGQERLLESLARHAAQGMVTLLCSSACVDPARCHRTLVAALVEARLAAEKPKPAASLLLRRPARQPP